MPESVNVQVLGQWYNCFPFYNPYWIRNVALTSCTLLPEFRHQDEVPVSDSARAVWVCAIVSDTLLPSIMAELS